MVQINIPKPIIPTPSPQVMDCFAIYRKVL